MIKLEYKFYYTNVVYIAEIKISYLTDDLKIISNPNRAMILWKRLVLKGMIRPARLRSNCMYTTIPSSQPEVGLI